MEREIIRAIDLVKCFGGIVALNKVSLTFGEGQISGVIGPNGAGKTTLINVINGVYEPDRGEVYFKNIRLNGLQAYEVAQLGISRTFQITRVFRRMSVLENMLSSSIYLIGKSKHAIGRALELLDFVGLLDMKDHYAYELSGGQQKLLEFARALMPDPEVVLMDEPFAGVHPLVKATLLNSIKEMNEKKGKTFAVISHDMKSIRDICNRLIVLNFGEKLVEGSTEDVLAHEDVIDAYLGKE